MRSWKTSKLTFLRDEIEPLVMNERFMIECSEGRFVMTKEEFYRDSANISKSEAYMREGHINYPQIPEWAWKYKIKEVA